VTEMEGVLVAALAWLGRTTLFIVEITGNAELVSVEAEGRPKDCWPYSSETKKSDLPGKLVTIPDPEVRRLAQGRLDSLGVPDLLEQDTLGVVLGVTGEYDVVLVDNGVGSLDNCTKLVSVSHGLHPYTLTVVCVECDAALLAEGVEILWPSGKGAGVCDLQSNINSNVRMSRTVRHVVLVATRRLIGVGHGGML
jgi:hypothetical protein